MVHLALMLAVIITKHVYGRPILPPLSMKDGCYLVSPEVPIFRQEGEAVFLSFPMFQRALSVRNISPPPAMYVITKDNGTEGEAFKGDGRVQQRDTQLWFLPAQASDSADYVCSYRNATYCVTGSIRLYVYESNSADMKKLYYSIFATVGQRLSYRCPSLSSFNKTGRLIEWYKDSNSTALQVGSVSSFNQENGSLIIPVVKQSHRGLYICQLRVLINDKQYKVSRTIQLNVEAPMISPPVIILPLNGTVFQSQHGSAVELLCQVLTGCQMADSTVVTWLVNGQSVESSYLDERALQEGRRVTKMSQSCQLELKLVVVRITKEDVKTELKCVTHNQGGRHEVVAQLQLEDSTFTWLVVAAVAISSFLTVVSIFLYVLFKPKRKTKIDYILARQNSTF